MANLWLSPLLRSYSQILDEILTVRQPTEAPEITDHNPSNIFVKWISAGAGMMEQLGYYVDNMGREANSQTARIYANMVRHARANDYRAKGARSAFATLLFTLSAPTPGAFSIPVNTVFTTDTGVKFRLLAAVNFGIGDSSAFGDVLQNFPAVAPITGLPVGTSNGADYQVFAIPPPTGAGEMVADNSVSVLVNALAWSPRETLGYSVNDAEDYVQTININGAVVVEFGDNFNGKIPPTGQAITANYNITLGAGGNVGAGEIKNTAYAPPFSLTLTVTNPERAAGGAGVETLEEMRRRIPLANRTLLRAVTRQDYIDIAELTNGVSRAGVYFSCGKTVDVYIVPEGGGIAPPALLAALLLYFADKRMITTVVNAKAAGELRFEFQIDITAAPNQLNSVVAANVTAALTGFISYLNQTIGGYLELSDIYQIIEAVAGVLYSKVNIMRSVPYARPLGVTALPLNWVRALQTGSVTDNQWQIKFINPTTYQYYKNGAFIANGTVGVPVVLPEINWTVNAAAYVAGYSWEFWTYNYFGTVVLQEPSLPVSLAGDISLNVTGGL